MTVDTYVEQALDRVECERAHVVEKQDGLATFASRVRGLDTAGSVSESATQPATGPMAGVRGAGDGCSSVRTAFEETVTPHVDESSVLESIRAELGREIALALSPTTPTAFTTGVKSQIDSAVTQRHGEIEVTLAALDRERESLNRAGQTVTEVTDWLVSANETPLLALDFEALDARHRKLSEFREACAQMVERRQTHLEGTTSQAASVGVDNRSLADSLYEDFPVESPVLATAAELVGLLEESQRAVRDHLVRRV